MSLLSFLESHYDVRTTRNDDEVLICCPSCVDNKFHGGFNLSKQVYGCFKCRKGLSAWAFLRTFHQLSTSEIKRIVSQDATFNYAQKKEEVVRAELEYPRNHRNLTPMTDSIIGMEAWNYVEKRFEHLTEYKVSIYRLKWGTGEGRFFGRIIIPCYKKGGRLVHLQGRAFLPEIDPKYWNEGGATKPLYGPDFYNAFGTEIYLVEGVFDAMAIGKGGVCIYGSAMTTEQLRALLKLNPSKITVAFDPDEAGVKASRDMVATLINYNGLFVDYEVYEVENLPSDPGSLKTKARNTIDNMRVKVT